MRFRFIEKHGRDFPTNRLCQVLDANAVYMPIAAVRPVKGSGQTWLSWPILRNSLVSAWGAMAVHA